MCPDVAGNVAGRGGGTSVKVCGIAVCFDLNLLEVGSPRLATVFATWSVNEFLKKKNTNHSVEYAGFVSPQFQGVTSPNLHHIWN